MVETVDLTTMFLVLIIGLTTNGKDIEIWIIVVVIISSSNTTMAMTATGTSPFLVFTTTIVFLPLPFLQSLNYLSSTFEEMSHGSPHCSFDVVVSRSSSTVSKKALLLCQSIIIIFHH